MSIVEKVWQLMYFFHLLYCRHWDLFASLAIFQLFWNWGNLKRRWAQKERIMYPFVCTQGTCTHTYNTFTNFTGHTSVYVYLNIHVLSVINLRVVVALFHPRPAPSICWSFFLKHRSQSALSLTACLFVCHVGLSIFIGNLNTTAVWNMILHLAASIPAALICCMEEQKEKSHFATAMAIRFASKVSFCCGLFCSVKSIRLCICPSKRMTVPRVSKYVDDHYYTQFDCHTCVHPQWHKSWMASAGKSGSSAYFDSAKCSKSSRVIRQCYQIEKAESSGLNVCLCICVQGTKSIFEFVARRSCSKMTTLHAYCLSCI